MSSTDLLIAVDSGVMTITLNRPDSLNAMTHAMWDGLVDAIDAGDTSADVRAIVVTGAGRAFCAGADISSSGGFTDLTKIDESYRDWGGKVAMRLYESNTPVIGAINGAAVGGGAGMLLPMDFRIASTTAKFGFVYTQRAVGAESASSWFLPRIVGISQALDWAITGRVFGAEEALAGGLVSKLVEPDALLDTVYELAHFIADKTAPASVAVIRQSFWKQLSMESPLDAHLTESRMMPHLASKPDAKEGVASFREKRPPRFTGTPQEYLAGPFPWEGNGPGR